MNQKDVYQNYIFSDTAIPLEKYEDDSVTHEYEQTSPEISIPDSTDCPEVTVAASPGKEQKRLKGCSDEALDGMEFSLDFLDRNSDDDDGIICDSNRKETPPAATLPQPPPAATRKLTRRSAGLPEDTHPATTPPPLAATLPQLPPAATMTLTAATTTLKPASAKATATMTLKPSSAKEAATMMWKKLIILCM